MIHADGELDVGHELEVRVVGDDDVAGVVLAGSVGTRDELPIRARSLFVGDDANPSARELLPKAPLECTMPLLGGDLRTHLPVRADAVAEVCAQLEARGSIVGYDALGAIAPSAKEAADGARKTAEAATAYLTKQIADAIRK